MAGTMAGYMPAQAQDNVQALIAQVKTLTVEKLKNVLRSEGLPLSGVKSELQIRTIAYIEKMRNAADMVALNRIRNTIRGVPHSYQNGNSYNPHYSNDSPASSASPQFASPSAHNNYYMPSTATLGQDRSPDCGSAKVANDTLSARYAAPADENLARESTRDTAKLIVMVSQDTLDTLHKDPSYRIMVFCTSENTGPVQRATCDIEFPHNVELKCNGTDIKANLKGLKNRPGTTRPVDITSFIKKKPANYPNSVDMIYALTIKDKSPPQKFYLVVNLVLQKSIDTMVADIRRGRVITKDQVIREMRRKAEDPDEIVATSMVLSLKDPVGYTRITTPCRGIGCNHVQCFDAALYLQLQEQAPTWTCPICNKAVPWEQLALDQYVNDILNLTPRSVEAVNVDPDGRWHIQNENETSSRRSNPTPSEDDDGDDDNNDGDDDGDLVELRIGPSFRPSNVETLTPHSVKTPPLSSREVSTAPSGSKPSAQTRKRPREVIDLTLSDDDDDEPPPKVSRASNSSSVDLSQKGPRQREDRMFYAPGQIVIDWPRRP
ncbi:hypothetical protein AYO21_10444 [Fonsecaea monophora]|uniref:Uncharacterized protein n=1 Tax=Fonsecaea monophora TaxID=254056 RepID=A0A177ETM6_9EURO|nr:hypothetical protein AYO21_10444 [Fonsecaea monophora]OAG35373.1 hypothetical protein AYO21_10444 [Fonsecaea monophora]